MRKFGFILVAVLIGLPSLQAQEYFRMGAKGGVNLANIVGDDPDWDLRTSFHLGLVAEIPLSEKFYFGPEVLYSSQGSKNEGVEIFNLDYIQIPMMVKYYVSQGLNIEAGPQIGFLISSEVNSFVVGSNVDLKDYLSTFDYGVNFGLGLKWVNGFFFQGRYNLGLANIWDDLEIGLDDDFKETNNVIQFSVGYMF